jgi:hypothetical protein
VWQKLLFCIGASLSLLALTQEAQAQATAVEIGHPVQIGRPVETGRPVATGRPVSVGQPAATGRPVSIGGPASIGRPVATGRPVSIGQPAAVSTIQRYTARINIEQQYNRTVVNIYIKEFAAVPSEVIAALLNPSKYAVAGIVGKWAESTGILPPINSKLPIQYRVVAPFIPAPVEFLIRPGIAE